MTAQREYDMFTRSWSVPFTEKFKYGDDPQYMLPDMTSPILMNPRWKSYQGELYR